MNPKLGDVGFKVGGKSYVLNMGVNAQCCVEVASKETVTEIILRISDGLATKEKPKPAAPARTSDIRMLFWAGLQRHQKGLDLDDVGDLMQRMAKDKSDKAPLDLVLESLTLCRVDDAEGAADGDENPQTPGEGGTGTPSS